MLYTYSVTPLKEDHFEERCEDIVSLVKSGAVYMPMFSMTLVPEGNPVWDKVGALVPLYARYRDALAAEGVSCGILVQASLGHAYRIEPNPFQKYVNLTDGREQFVCCPEDENFIRHFQDVLRTLAREHPAAIMLDDDFRMVVRPGTGCTCPLHMKAFNRRTGLSMTREELSAHIFSHPEDDPLTDAFRELQRDSLIRAATAFRAAIDEVDPTIQGINCTSGHYCDSVIYTSPIFAGKGNPTVVRVPNGIYAPISVRGFSDLMRQGAICASRLKKHGIDVVLAETDTVPFNRYGKSARHLHAHYAASILEGLKGAKHWLTRTSAFEPDSGKAYRKILAEHKGLYERLAALSDGVVWLGVNSAFIEQEKFTFQKPNFRRYHDNDWVTGNLERMGLPFYFSDEFCGATFLEGDIVADMTDAQCEGLWRGSVFADAQAARDLIARGYGSYLGVTVTPWEDERVSGECFDDAGVMACSAQKDLHRLTLADGDTRAASYNFVRERHGVRLLSPAVTVKTRADGHLSVVFCGSPTAKFHYTEGFAFLNESRKRQLVSLLREARALPVYCVGDDELCLRVGRVRDGRLLVSLYDLGTDPAEELTLFLETPPIEITMLTPDGKEASVAWTACGDGCYTLSLRIEPMYPVFLLIRS